MIDKIKNFIQKLTKPFFRITTKQYDIKINNKPLLEKSVMLWDIENIPYKHFQYFEKFFKYTPENVFVVSKQTLGQKAKNFLDKKGFSYIQATTIADDKIIKFLKIKNFNNNDFIVLSSDSDFAPIVKQLLDAHKKVQVITNNANNKRLLMNLPLTHKNIEINAFDIVSKTKKTRSTQSIIKDEIITNDKVYIDCDICKSKVLERYSYFKIPCKNKTTLEKNICRSCFETFKKRYTKNLRDTQSYHSFKKEYFDDIKFDGFYDVEKYIQSDDVVQTDKFTNSIDFSKFK
ncbi:MAG: NYN domain-containing protein [Campylobacterota bacterium]|nr:NYN domain-containing protein [Campylobacterota bacterium]